MVRCVRALFFLAMATRLACAVQQSGGPSGGGPSRAPGGPSEEDAAALEEARQQVIKIKLQLVRAKFCEGFSGECEDVLSVEELNQQLRAAQIAMHYMRLVARGFSPYQIHQMMMNMFGSDYARHLSDLYPDFEAYAIRPPDWVKYEKTPDWINSRIYTKDVTSGNFNPQGVRSEVLNAQSDLAATGGSAPGIIPKGRYPAFYPGGYGEVANFTHGDNFTSGDGSLQGALDARAGLGRPAFPEIHQHVTEPNRAPFMREEHIAGAESAVGGTDEAPSGTRRGQLLQGQAGQPESDPVVHYPPIHNKKLRPIIAKKAMEVTAPKVSKPVLLMNADELKHRQSVAKEAAMNVFAAAKEAAMGKVAFRDEDPRLKDFPTENDVTEEEMKESENQMGAKQDLDLAEATDNNSTSADSESDNDLEDEGGGNASAGVDADGNIIEVDEVVDDAEDTEVDDPDNLVVTESAPENEEVVDASDDGYIGTWTPTPTPTVVPTPTPEPTPVSTPTVVPPTPTPTPTMPPHPTLLPTHVISGEVATTPHYHGYEILDGTGRDPGTVSGEPIFPTSQSTGGDCDHRFPWKCNTISTAALAVAAKQVAVEAVVAKTVAKSKAHVATLQSMQNSAHKNVPLLLKRAPDARDPKPLAYKPKILIPDTAPKLPELTDHVRRNILSAEEKTAPTQKREAKKATLAPTPWKPTPWKPHSNSQLPAKLGRRPKAVHHM